MVSRTDRSNFAEWWWTVDRYLLVALIALMVGGIVLSFAGSPPVAERLGYDSFHFVKRHVAFFLPALAVMITTSFLTPRQARRVALIVLIVSMVLMLVTLFVGVEVKGARRWITIASLSIQPSEFMKPAFVVIVAWLFAENSRRADIPGNAFALAVERTLEMHGTSVDADIPSIRSIEACENFHERGLACAVLSADRQNFARTASHRDAVKDRDGAKTL